MISSVLFLIATGLLLRFGSSPRLTIITAGLVPLFLLLWVIYCALDGVTGNGFDSSVVYHLHTGLAGSGVAGYEFYVLKWLGITVVAICFSLFYIKKIPVSVAFRWRHCLPVLILFGAIISNPIVAQIKNQIPLIKIVSQSGDSLSQIKPDLGELDKFYAIPSIDALKTLNKNIVLVYMEGLENTYFNQGLFGNLLPNLNRLSEQAIRFKPIYEGAFTGWTMGGIVGSQCGIPLVPMGKTGGNNLTGFERFLPGAICLGDVLSQVGYHSEFIGGASLVFAGKGDFLKTHGYNNQWGREELRNIFDMGIKTNTWGYYDDAILNYSKQRFLDLYKKESPFFLTMLTLDTHPPKGFVSSTCEIQGITRKDNPIQDAVRCSDYLISDYVRFIKKNDPHNNTLVVLFTDHRSHPNTAFKKLESEPKRGLIFWIFDPTVKGDIVEVKNATTFDVAATILSLAGADVDRFGFGRNLLSLNNIQVPEWPFLNKHLAQMAAYFWRTVPLEGALQLPHNKNILIIGTERYRLPALINFTDDNKVESVVWPSKHQELMSLFATNNAIMIDDCIWIDENEPGTRCIYYRSKKGLLSAESLDGVDFLDAKSVIAVLDGDNTVSSIAFNSLGYLASNGGHGSFSGVLFQGKMHQFSRGVTLLYLKNGSPEIIHRFDTCRKGVNDTMRQHFKKLVRGINEKIHIIVADSANCGTDNLQDLVKDFDAPIFKKLGFRQPYIGIISENNKVIYEMSGDQESRLIYHVK